MPNSTTTRTMQTSSPATPRASLAIASGQPHTLDISPAPYRFTPPLQVVLGESRLAIALIAPLVLMIFALAWELAESWRLALWNAVLRCS